MGVLEGIEESTQKNTKTTKMDLDPTKNSQNHIKTWTPVRLKIRKGMELGGNHDMWWPPGDL